jgi:hypothetical protein
MKNNVIDYRYMSRILLDKKMESEIAIFHKAIMKHKLLNKKSLYSSAEDFFRIMFSEYVHYCLGGRLLLEMHPPLATSRGIAYIMKKYNLKKPEYHGTPEFEMSHQP